MANAIETELLEATGLKKKVGETFQKFATRLVAAVQEIPEDDWDKLSDEAQAWTNAGSKAINADKDVARFPADEEAEQEEDEKPKRGGRRAAEEEEPEDEPDEKPARGRSRRAEPEEEEEPEEKPARRSSRRAEPEEEEPEEKPARRGRAAKDEEEDEPDEKPARGRSRRAAAEEEDEDKPARKPAKKEPAKPAARGRKDPDAKGPSATTLLKKMLMKNPKLKTDDILAELEDKHGLKPTPMAVASIRSAFIHSMRVLNEAGHLSEKMAAKLD